MDNFAIALNDESSVVTLGLFDNLFYSELRPFNQFISVDYTIILFHVL